jgi:hypothetical protein
MILFAAAFWLVVYAAAESKRAAQAIPVMYGSDRVTLAVDPVNELTNWLRVVSESRLVATEFGSQRRLTFALTICLSGNVISRLLAYGR